MDFKIKEFLSKLMNKLSHEIAFYTGPIYEKPISSSWESDPIAYANCSITSPSSDLPVGSAVG